MAYEAGEPIYNGLQRLRAEAFEGAIGLVTDGSIGLEEQTSEAAMLEQLGSDFSRTALREALAIMSFEGIITQKPQVGLWFNRVSAVEMEDLLAVGEDAEAVALARLANGKGDAGITQSLRAGSALFSLNVLGDFPQNEVLKADTSFHRGIMLDGSMSHISNIVATNGVKRRLFQAENPLDQEQCKSIVERGLELVAELPKAVLVPTTSKAQTLLADYYAEQIAMLTASEARS